MKLFSFKNFRGLCLYIGDGGGGGEGKQLRPGMSIFFFLEKCL